MKQPQHILRFKVQLRDVRPAIWRRIEVPASYSFWDLHVAIQDALGWFDSHLHVFRVDNPRTGEVEQIGIPDPVASRTTRLSWKGGESWLRNIYRTPGIRRNTSTTSGTLFVNPVAIGRGMQVFKNRKPLKLTGSTAYPSGVVVNSYEPA